MPPRAHSANMPHRSLHPVMLRVYGTRYPSFLLVIPFMVRNYRVASEAKSQLEVLPSEH